MIVILTGLAYTVLLWCMFSRDVPVPAIVIFPFLGGLQLFMHYRYKQFGAVFLLLPSTFIGIMGTVVQLGKIDSFILAVETFWLWLLFKLMDSVIDDDKSDRHQYVEDLERAERTAGVLQEKEKVLHTRVTGLELRLENYTRLQRFTDELATVLKVPEACVMIERNVKHFLESDQAEVKIFPETDKPDPLDKAGGWIARHRIPFFVQAHSEDPRFPMQERLRHHAVMVVPLVRADKIMGTLTAWKMVDEQESKRESASSISYQNDIRFLADIASLSSLALVNAELYEKTEALATQDSLTALLVRYLFDEKIEEEFSRARIGHVSLSLIMFDIDFFKKVNDSYGHSAGDWVLKTVAKIISGQTREADLVYRYGGEEIAVIAPYTKVQDVLNTAERVRKMIENSPIIFEGQAVRVTVSGGVAAVDASMKSAQELVNAADKSLYEAKHAGRNRIVKYGK